MALSHKMGNLCNLCSLNCTKKGQNCEVPPLTIHLLKDHWYHVLCCQYHNVPKENDVDFFRGYQQHGLIVQREVDSKGIDSKVPMSKLKEEPHVNIGRIDIFHYMANTTIFQKGQGTTKQAYLIKSSAEQE